MRLWQTLSLLAVVSLVIAFAGCTGGSDEDDPTATPSAVPTTSPSGNSFAPPAATPVKRFEYESEAIAFTYGTEWRVSARSPQSITLTGTDAPGAALLAVQWQARPPSGDYEEQYLQQLAAVGAAIEQLTDILIDGEVAHRYASTRSSSGDGVISLSVLFESGDWTFLATLSTDSADLGEFADRFDEVLETIEVR